MQLTQTIAPCLWFDDQGRRGGQVLHRDLPELEDRGRDALQRCGGRSTNKRQPGSVMTVELELNGHTFHRPERRPHVQVQRGHLVSGLLRYQDEIDHYWGKLSEGGDPNAQQCGWLKDKYGVSWQVVPRGMAEMLKGSARRGCEAGNGPP